MADKSEYEAIREKLVEHLDDYIVKIFDTEYQRYVEANFEIRNTVNQDSSNNREDPQEEIEFEQFFMDFINMYFIQPEKLFESYKVKINEIFLSTQDSNKDDEKVELNFGILEEHLKNDDLALLTNNINTEHSNDNKIISEEIRDLEEDIIKLRMNLNDSHE